MEYMRNATQFVCTFVLRARGSNTSSTRRCQTFAIIFQIKCSTRKLLPLCRSFAVSLSSAARFRLHSRRTALRIRMHTAIAKLVSSERSVELRSRVKWFIRTCISVFFNDSRLIDVVQWIGVTSSDSVDAKPSVVSFILFSGRRKKLGNKWKPFSQDSTDFSAFEQMLDDCVM